MKEYNIEIERGKSQMNDVIFNIMLQVMEGKILDVGCNTGQLMSDYLMANPRGKAVGVDASSIMVKKAKEKGLDVVWADACKLPFKDKSFDVVVLSCVLEQIEDWRAALKEAMRVGKTVVGINPLPARDEWGFIKGHVKSIIQPAEIARIAVSENDYIVTLLPFLNTKFFFRIICD